MQLIGTRTGAFVLAALTAATWLFVGCKKSDQLVDPATVSAPPEESTALSPAEQCFADCDTQHAGSAALFDAMDDCSEQNCKLGDQDPAFSPKACAPIDNKVITYNYDEVDNCLAAICCDQVTACANDADCAAASSCYDRCIGLEVATEPTP